ncbi:MAG: hypothetical protein L6R38_002873 [Xanthoria sp. 2 TBL-2021]|nr:MAG: hypothetical protein L6R38_002873 [Xanthoria sp. 2 TBL-2021]
MKRPSLSEQTSRASPAMNPEGSSAEILEWIRQAYPRGATAMKHGNNPRKSQRLARNLQDPTEIADTLPPPAVPQSLPTATTPQAPMADVRDPPSRRLLQLSRRKLEKGLDQLPEGCSSRPRDRSTKAAQIVSLQLRVSSTKVVYNRLMDCRRRPDLPSKDELIGLARHYYPARADLKIQVCDFGLGRAERNEITLGQIEEYWQAKPDWVDVRWIHAPLGLGLTHSSVEDIFLHDGQPGREFENGGASGWPYLETEVLNIRSHKDFQEMRDVYLILSRLKELEKELDQCSFKNDENSSLQSDISWRANHLAMEANYWNLVSSDMPWQLTEGLVMRGPTEGLQPISRQIGQQTLCNHPFYKDCHMVRNIFRCFHRSDGILLTLSPMAGVNFLDQKLAQHLSEPADAIFDNENASAPGYVFSAFADQGTSTWHRRTVEWFLTYLITEIGVTPHAHRQGFNAPDLNLAYQAVINDLKRRRYAPWRKDETVKLVRDYLACVDELTTVKSICQQQVNLFKGMQQDVRKFEQEDNRARRTPDNPQGESMHERVKWALTMVKTRHDTFERLLTSSQWKRSSSSVRSSRMSSPS